MENGEAEHQDGGGGEREEPPSGSKVDQSSPQPADGDTSTNDVNLEEDGTKPKVMDEGEPAAEPVANNEASAPADPDPPAPSATPPPAEDPSSSVPEATLQNNDPVNLKVSETSRSPPVIQQEEPQHHVRTITLTSDYRQQEQMAENSASTVVIYAQPEEPTADHQDAAATAGSYVYQQQQNYPEESEGTVRYRTEPSTSSTGKLELLDAAAAAAGVPTGHYTIMMVGDEEDPAEQGSSTAYLGSRLATFQVFQIIIRISTRYFFIYSCVFSCD